jgi:hypothetical protein
MGGLYCNTQPNRYRGCYWFLGCEVVIMAFLIAFPQISLFLPNLMIEAESLRLSSRPHAPKRLEMMGVRAHHGQVGSPTGWSHWSALTSA